MSGEFSDVGDDQRLQFRCGGSTYTAPEGNLETAEAPLVRPDAKELSRLNNSIEAGPQMPEGIMDESRDRGHPGDWISHPLKDGIAVSLKLEVRLSLGYPP